MAGFRKKMHEMFDFDVSENNGNEAVAENQAGEAEDSKEITKEEVLKLVSLYVKKDSSIRKDLDKLIERPAKSDEDIIFDFKAVALKNKKVLKETIGELIDKDKEIQKIVDELATKPEPTKEPEPVKEPEPAPQPTVPVVFDIKHYTQELIYSLREHPEVRDKILDPKTDLAPRRIAVFFDERNDPLHENPLLEADIKTTIYGRFAGDIEKACGNAGWYVREYRIADRYGNPTKTVFPLESKGSGK
ncbi:MAG: hypothetical protein Q4A25_01855 [Candidatus Saccharibacteria bacterium]|nr:hypothetical protein [Candidatus Saccharibacteria bacterium]